MGTLTNSETLPESGGKVEVAAGLNAITLNVTGPLAPGANGVTLTRAEAEAVAKALTAALAKLRAADAMPERAEPLEAPVKRKAKA